jgi:hypothetical protein
MNPLTTAIKSLIHETIDENPSIITLKRDVAELKTDVAVLKVDVAQLKVDVAELKADMVIVKKDIVKLYEGQLYLGGMMEDMKHTLNLVLEAVRPGQGRATLVEEVAAKVDDHEYRISAVESVVKERGV